MTTDVLDPVALTAAAAAYGTLVGASAKRKYSHMKAYNGTAGNVTLDVYLVPAAGAAANLTQYISHVLEPEETYLCPEVIGACLKTGGQLWASGLDLSLSAVATDSTNT